MNLKNKSNAYIESFGNAYDHIPKAVWAAIAISLATTGGDYLSDAERLILEEWRILHENGIIPQVPRRTPGERD